MKTSGARYATPVRRWRGKIRKTVLGAASLTYGLRNTGGFWNGGWQRMDGFRCLYFLGIEL